MLCKMNRYVQLVSLPLTQVLIHMSSVKSNIVMEHGLHG